MISLLDIHVLAQWREWNMSWQ